jgi:hypothetical protein
MSRNLYCPPSGQQVLVRAHCQPTGLFIVPHSELAVGLVLVDTLLHLMRGASQKGKMEIEMEREVFSINFSSPLKSRAFFHRDV